VTIRELQERSRHIRGEACANYVQRRITERLDRIAERRTSRMMERENEREGGQR
jgi:hypothetical protein